MEKYLLTREEAAARYSYSVRGLEELYKRQKSFPIVKVGRRVLVPMAEADQWFASQSRAEAMTS